jgi:hypothetical protein
MNMTHISCFHRLAALVTIGLSLAASACSGGGNDESTGPGSSSSSSSSDTSTGGTDTGEATDTTAPTSDPTTGSTGSSTLEPTTDPITGSTGTSSSSSGDDTGSSSGTTVGVDEPALSFFVSSTGSPTGDLGGIEGADKRCQDLAEAVGAGAKTWRAYLGVEQSPVGGPEHPRDRIGQGPWYNAKMVMIAADLDDLHTKDGDAELFLDENGEKVPGQWEGSPDPNQHDILTGANKDGTVAMGKTCNDWTSDDPGLLAQVGHSDGLGPNMSAEPQFRSWNSVHESGGCNDTAPKGGAGRVYCFAID